jgi:hypothetical protein
VLVVGHHRNRLQSWCKQGCHVSLLQNS